jgi:hypothetical protein
MLAPDGSSAPARSGNRAALVFALFGITAFLAAMAGLVLKFVVFAPPPSRPLPAWVRIVEDETLFPKGEVWQRAEAEYKAGREAGPEGTEQNTGKFTGYDPSDLIGLGGILGGAALTPETLRDRYGVPAIETPADGPDKGVTYHMYGPIGFGLAPGDKFYTYLRAERSLLEHGFMNEAKAVEAMGRKK